MAARQPARGSHSHGASILTPETPGVAQSGVGADGGRAWRFSVPYPPSTNTLYATVNGRRVKSKAARDYTDVVGDMASIMRARVGTPAPPYGLTIELYAPDLRRRDADNGVKCLQDALLRGTGRDDAEVVSLHVFKRGVDRYHPRADVTLEHDDRQEG